MIVFISEVRRRIQEKSGKTWTDNLLRYLISTEDHTILRKGRNFSLKIVTTKGYIAELENIFRSSGFP